MHDSTKRLPHGVRSCAALVVAGLTALVLSGCVGEPAPTPTAPPSEAAEPIFASDEEALAAAEAAYERFLATSVAVTNDGGLDAIRVAEVASGQALEEEQAAAARFREQGLRTSGSIDFGGANLQSISLAEAGSTAVTFYVCDDIRGLDILDSSGVSLVVQGRVVDVPYTVVVEGTDPNLLKVSEKTLWARENFCLS